MVTATLSGKLTAEDRRSYDYTQHDQLINKFINRKLVNYNSSDVCLEREDIVNMCRAHLMKALEDYDPTRGQKLTSYIYMVLDSRLGNLRARIQKKNLSRTSNMTAMNCWSATGGGGDDDTGAINTGIMKETFKEFVRVEDCLLESIDVMNVFQKLPPQRQLLFREFFLEGWTVLEIHQRHPDIGYHKIRNELKSLEKIYTTLCEGNVL